MSTPEINRIRDRLRLLDQAAATPTPTRAALGRSNRRYVADLPWRTALWVVIVGLLVLMAAGVMSVRPAPAASQTADAAVATALAQLRPDARDVSAEAIVYAGDAALRR